MIPVSLDIFSDFLNPSLAFSLTGFESVVVSFIIGILAAMIIKHLLGLAIAVGALFAILVVVGAATFSLSSVSNLALTVWQFFSGYSKPIEKLVLGAGIDSTLALVIGLALGYFGIPGVTILTDH